MKICFCNAFVFYCVAFKSGGECIFIKNIKEALGFFTEDRREER